MQYLNSGSLESVTQGGGEAEIDRLIMCYVYSSQKTRKIISTLSKDVY
jgi:hypothetical protein